MELSHTFVVPAPIEQTWEAFNDLEMVAGCFPGASLSSVDGDDFKGSCKVKLGPISLVYSGTGKFVQRDESAHRFVIEAMGKDKRGNGTAGATVTAVLTVSTTGSTSVEVDTDLSITGKPAQFGRGVIQDVSDKLLRQFVTCLESKVGETDGAAVTPSETTAATVGATGEEPATAHPAMSSGTELSEGAQTGGERETDDDVPPAIERTGEGATRPSSAGAAPRADEPADVLDLGGTLLPILLKSYGRQFAVALGVVAALVALKRLMRRRR